jgi:hypothetical protein
VFASDGIPTYFYKSGIKYEYEPVTNFLYFAVCTFLHYHQSSIQQQQAAQFSDAAKSTPCAPIRCSKTAKDSGTESDLAPSRWRPPSQPTAIALPFLLFSVVAIASLDILG